MPIFTNKKDKWRAAEEGRARRTELDAGDRRRYDRAVSKDPRTEQPRVVDGDDAERKRVVAKIERGLADSEAGRVVPHAEVMARMEARYSGSDK